MLSWLSGAVVNAVLGKFTDLFQAYLNKQITEAELREKLSEAMLEAFKSVEISHAQVLGQTYASFTQVMIQSRVALWVWASVTMSELAVLLWHQVGIPAIVALGIVERYPSSGSTVEWSYALVGACVGLGPLVLRSGPAASGFGMELVKNLRTLGGR